MTNKNARFLAVLSLGLAGTLFGGCPLLPSEPPPEAVLSGDWTAALPDGSDAVFTLDDQGEVTRISATTVDGVTIVYNVSGSTTTLDGDQVTIRVPLGSSGTGTFAGTLSSDQNTIEGALSRQITIEDTLTVTIPAGALTLTRVVN